MDNFFEITNKNPDIVDKNLDYFCVFCSNGLLQPKQLCCGHRICAPCLEQIEANQMSETIQCPAKDVDNCEDSLINKIFPDKSAEKDMKSIQIYCPYKHVGCKAIFLYSSLRRHLEEYHSEDAQSSIEFDGLLKHDLKCCRYIHIGCQEYFRKESDLVSHESDVSAHMNIILKKLERLYERILTMNFDLTKLDKDTEALEFQSMEMQRELLRLGRCISDLQRIETNQKKMLDTLKRMTSLEVQKSSTPFVLEDETRNKLIQHDKCIVECDVSLSDINLKADIIATTSYSGILVWKVADYWARKRSGRSLTSPVFFTSRYGYKMSCRLYLNGDGPGKESHLSIFFALLRSDYDDILPWPFSRRVTFFLMDQCNTKKDIKYSFEPDPRSPSFQKPAEVSNIAFGCPLFIRHSILENSDGPFMKDNQIFLKVVVGDIDKQTKQLTKE